MDDTVSRTSQDSAADEFVVVTTEPKLYITGNGGASELERKMTEILNDDSSVVSSNAPAMAATDKFSELPDDKPMTSDEVQPNDEFAAADATEMPERCESGNSFNNLNTSTNNSAAPGDYFEFCLWLML